MLHERLEAITSALLDEACANAWPETQTLEFKRILPAKDDQGRLAFLLDVCAMANGDGGDIVYGIGEANGIASVVMPIDPATAESADAAERRLSQLIEARIEPRMPRPEFRAIACTAGGYALVLRVPASYVGPHRVTVDGVNRFMLRSGSHNADMSYDQLRRAFDRTATLSESARSFRAQRLELIGSGHTWRPLLEGPVCVLHAIPLQAMGGRVQLDIAAAHEDFTDLSGSWRGGLSRSTNLDGLIVYPPEINLFTGRNALPGYTQLFRDGAIEAVYTGRGLATDESVIPSTVVTRFYRSAVDMALCALRRRGVTGPVIVAAALLRVTAYKFVIDQRFYSFGPEMPDRSNLVLPETWIDDVGTPLANVHEVARPMLDVLWQSFGLPRCLEYDEQGNFQG